MQETTHNQTPQIYTTAEVAQQLGVTIQAVRMMVLRGTIDPLKTTTAGHLFEAAELQRYRARRRPKGRPRTTTGKRQKRHL